MAAISDLDGRQRLSLDSNARILLFGTEGATDRELYRKIVGIEASEILG